MITGLNHITLAVNDIEESFQFYVDVLGCKPIQKNPGSAYILAGDLWIALGIDDHARTEPMPEYTHFAFTVPQEHFQTMAKRIIASGAKEWKTNNTEGDSLYFLDPNGHKLEIHASDLNARIQSGKKEWGDHIQWFV